MLPALLVPPPAAPGPLCGVEARYPNVSRAAIEETISGYDDTPEGRVACLRDLKSAQVSAAIELSRERTLLRMGNEIGIPLLEEEE